MKITLLTTSNNTNTEIGSNCNIDSISEIKIDTNNSIVTEQSLIKEDTIKFTYRPEIVITIEEKIE